MPGRYQDNKSDESNKAIMVQQDYRREVEGWMSLNRWTMEGE